MVEDDLNIQNLIRIGIDEITLSKKYIVNIILTDNYQKALDLAIHNKIDLFILDIILDQDNGMTLAKELRSISRYKFTPIIFETCLIKKELETYRDAAAHYCLIKPFTKESVITIVTKALEMTDILLQEPNYIFIKRNGITHKISIDEVIYFESIRKDLLLNTYNGNKRQVETELLRRCSLKEILGKSPNNTLLMCHRSYIINKIYINKIDWVNQMIELRYCSEKVPIGKKFSIKLKEGNAYRYFC